MSAGGTQLHDTGEAARRQKRKPDVDTDELIREIEVLTNNLETVTFGNTEEKTRRIESVEQYFNATRQLPSMELPGFGERREDCGTPLPHFCGEGHTTDIDRTCNGSTCPRCASSWVRRRAVAKVDQLLGLLKVKLKRKPWLSVFFHHVVVSPPPGWEAESQDAFEDGWDVVRSIMHEMDMEGIAAYHPYRGPEEGPEGENDMGAWKERLFSNRDWDDVRDELEFSPHWHVITATSWVPGNSITREIEARTGWVVHRIANEDTGRSINSDDGMVRAVTYCISHAGIYEDSNGDMQGAVREIGRTINQDVTVGENHEWAKQKTKEIAWQTLGIPTAELICDATKEESAGITLGRLPGSTRVSSREADLEGSTSTAELGDDGGGDLDDGPEAVDVDDPDGVDGGADRHAPTEQRCGGDLSKLHAAPHKLNDEDWVQQADAPEELLETYEEWVDEEPLLADIAERIGFTGHEDWIEELRSGAG